MHYGLRIGVQQRGIRWRGLGRNHAFAAKTCFWQRALLRGERNFCRSLFVFKIAQFHLVRCTGWVRASNAGQCQLDLSQENHPEARAAIEAVSVTRDAWVTV